jgi:arabinose-5-phosphate isomerase
VIGIITDGDIRRMLEEILCRINCKDIMTKLIQSNDMVVDALNILEDFSITQLVVVDHDEYKGVYIYMTF